MALKRIRFKTFIPDELEQAIDEIGHGFGSKYTLTEVSQLLKSQSAQLLAVRGLMQGLRYV